MTVADLIAALESIAPARFAEPWDNVGLLLGDPASALRGPVLVALDLTDAVVQEAVSTRAGAIVAYHPPIFEPLKRLTPDSAHGGALLRAAGEGVAILSPHTALDAAPGGLTDWLADLISAGVQGNASAARRPLVPSCPRDASQTHKIVVFVPVDPPGTVEKVRDAMAHAGAGRIGAYSKCSFELRGEGTFLGGEGSIPTVGKRGRLERVHEIRLEMVCGEAMVSSVIAATRRSHPYEEPAIDLYELTVRPDPAAGAGRLLTFSRPTSSDEIAMRLRKQLGTPVHVTADTAGQPADRVAVVPGSGASLLDEAIAQGAGVFMTGEMKHHDVLAAIERRCGVVLLGHGESERPYLPILAQRLGSMCAGVSVAVAKADRPPLRTL